MAVARTRLTKPFSGLGHLPPRFRGGLVVAVERADEVGKAAVSPSDGELHLPSVPRSLRRRCDGTVPKESLCSRNTSSPAAPSLRRSRPEGDLARLARRGPAALAAGRLLLRGRPALGGVRRRSRLLAAACFDAPGELAIFAARSFDMPLSFRASYCFSFLTFALLLGIASS